MVRPGGRGLEVERGWFHPVRGPERRDRDLPRRVRCAPPSLGGPDARGIEGVARLEEDGAAVIGILTCGLPPAVDGSDHPTLRVLDAPDPSLPPGAAIVDTVEGPLRDGATVLAIVPTWDLEPHLAALQVARSALDSTRLVVHRTDLPPLAAAALAHTAAELTSRELVPDGVLASVMPTLERHVVGAAWLGSVARLREPAPRLGLHARSYLPGASFGAVVDEDPRVVPLRRKEAATLPLPMPRVAGGWRVWVAWGEGGDAEVVRRSITQFAPGAPTDRVELSAISRSWWGTDKLVELALAPADPAALAADLTAGLDPTTCRWCDERIATDVCPFCRARSRPTEDEYASGGRT